VFDIQMSSISGNHFSYNTIPQTDHPGLIQLIADPVSVDQLFNNISDRLVVGGALCHGKN
jgi:hypothetical protein